MAEPAQGTDTPYSIRAVQRVLDILDLLQEAQTVSLGKVAEVTGLPKSSAFRYLSTLEARRYVERDRYSGEYRIGLAFLPFQSSHLKTVTDRARPHMEALRDRFEETISLGLLDGRRVIYLETVESRRSMRFVPGPGERHYIHSTALGKAIAAQLDEEEVLQILSAERMPRQTPQTIVGADAFLDHLQQVRDRGYALNDAENEPDSRCIAVPLLAGGLPLAISVSAPAARFPRESIETTAGVLRKTAEQLARELRGE